jgi:RNA polymerase sigma-70 factor, ECF subfamily
LRTAVPFLPDHARPRYWARPRPLQPIRPHLCHTDGQMKTDTPALELVPETELIRQVLEGDPAAERKLYDEHVDRVYRLCYRLACADAGLAQDFTQETFVKAFSKLSDFRGQARLSTWLHTIAVSVSLNGMRRVKRWRDRETSFDDAPDLGSTPRDAEPDLKVRLRKAIDRLPEPHRVVFVMFDMEGYTHEEIGEVLLIPTGTSKARLSRARAQLRQELADFAGEWVT